MKKELSAYEIRHLVEEFGELNGAKVEKIYQPDKRALLIEFHLKNKGKRYFVINEKFVYLASSKGTVPERPSGFCVFLRKHLEGSRLKEIEQHDFERIVELVFEGKHGENSSTHRLVVELFGRGNIILCGEEYTILMPLEVQKWERCEVRPKQKYVFPKQKYDFVNLSKGTFEELLRETEKENLVKMFAIDVGLGGTYAEEICARAGINKMESPKEIHGKEITLLFSALDELRKEKKEPAVVFNKEEVLDIVPVALDVYKNMKQKRFDSYNEALDEVLTKKEAEAKNKLIKSRMDKEIEKVENIISIQKKHLAAVEKESSEAKERGELIYNNYELVSGVINELKKARERYSWKEIKEKLKGHKVIKKIDEKTGEIVLEI